MTGAPASPQTRLGMVVPEAGPAIVAWIGTAPANSPGAPSGPHQPAPPQVIYAERRPRLSGAEVLARHRARLQASTPDLPAMEPGRKVTARALTPNGQRYRTLTLRPLWWSALALATAMLSAGTPVL